MTRALPPSASVAAPREGAKLHAPSAERNAGDIAAVLQTHAPETGKALEIASGTGQHICAFAMHLPTLIWQPTDVDPNKLRSIDAYVAEGKFDNVRPAAQLDATTIGWANKHLGQDLIVLINLLHLISDVEAQTIIHEASRALAPEGTIILYGPFARDGALISDGDARFDAELRAADPAIGYKDTRDIVTWIGDAGLRANSHDMPANNLTFVCRKPYL